MYSRVSDQKRDIISIHFDCCLGLMEGSSTVMLSSRRLVPSEVQCDYKICTLTQYLQYLSTSSPAKHLRICKSLIPGWSQKIIVQEIVQTTSSYVVNPNLRLWNTSIYKTLQPTKNQHVPSTCRGVLPRFCHRRKHLLHHSTAIQSFYWPFDLLTFQDWTRFCKNIGDFTTVH